MNLLNNKYTAKITKIKREMYSINIQFTITEGEFAGRNACIDIGTAFSRKEKEKNTMTHEITGYESIFKKLLKSKYSTVCNNILYLYGVLLHEADSLLNKKFNVTIEDKTIFNCA